MWMYVRIMMISWRLFANSVLQLILNDVEKEDENDLVSIGRDLHELTYKYNNNMYKIRIPKRHAPSDIEYISGTTPNGTEWECDDEIRAFMGPSHNFHGIPTTPKMLGYSVLVFEHVDGRSETYGENEIIKCSH
jgi:hypothetical protein